MSNYDINQLDRLEPPYLLHYGLTSAPFPPTHEDRFLYLDAERQQRLNMLHHLTRYSSLLLIVSGARGSGKTSLKQRFVANAENEWRICEVDAHPMMDNHELLTRIGEGFGLLDLPTSAEDLQGSLFKYLNSLHHNAGVPVLLIDDAHELPQDALEAIFHLADIEAGDGNLLRTILFCEPEINTMLESPYIQPLRERITHSMEIPPLDEEHTAEYIRHRLAIAGLQGSSPFSDKDIRRIYKSSQGLPERINEAAHMFLSGEQYETEEEPDDKAPFSYNPRHMLLGIFTACIIIAVLVFQEQINALFDPAIQQQQAGKPAKPAPPSEDKAGKPGSTDITQEKTLEFDISKTGSGTSTETKIKPATPPISQSAEELPELPFVNQYTPPAVTAVTASVTETAALQISRISPKPVNAGTAPQIITIYGKGFSNSNEVILYWSGNSKTLKSDQLEYVSSEQLNINIRVGSTADTWKVLIKDPRNKTQTSSEFTVVARPAGKTDPAAPVPSEVKTAADTGTAWLQAQPLQNYSLQLLASYSKESILHFIAKHKLDKDIAITTSQRNNKPWYALIYGSHATRREAELAATQLPASMKAIKPWIRSFTGINAAKQSRAILPTVKPDRQTSWLWEQDPRHYTLQLLGGRNESALKDFIRKHRLKGGIAVFRTLRDGKPWFALVYGSYPGRDEAQQAISKLPADLQKTTPWARSFASIHNDLYRN